MTAYRPTPVAPGRYGARRPSPSEGPFDVAVTASVGRRSSVVPIGSGDRRHGRDEADPPPPRHQEQTYVRGSVSLRTSRGWSETELDTNGGSPSRGPALC